jgi:hypothetical protein
MLLSRRQREYNVKLDFMKRISVALAGLIGPFGGAVLNGASLLGASSPRQERCGGARRRPAKFAP